MDRQNSRSGAAPLPSSRRLQWKRAYACTAGGANVQQTATIGCEAHATRLMGATWHPMSNTQCRLLHLYWWRLQVDRTSHGNRVIAVFDIQSARWTLAQAGHGRAPVGLQMEMQALSLVASRTSAQTRLPARDSASPPLLISSSASLFTYPWRATRTNTTGL